MRKTINDVLLSLGESAQEERFNLTVDMGIYKKLVKELPRRFPMPDEFYTRPTMSTDYDAMLIYNIRQDENPEALRIIISMMMGLLDWEIEIDKTNRCASLRSVKYFGDYALLVKLVDVDTDLFEYTITNDTGTLLTGSVQCRKFVELDTLREDVSPEVFYEQLKASSYKSFIYAKQAYICSLAAQGLPKQLPIPDTIIPALGLTYDLDLNYITDNNGRLREKIDSLLGYEGWSAVISKHEGLFSLHTIVTVPCLQRMLKVRINILDAYKKKEQLFLVTETSEHLIYRAIRQNDPDYKETIALFGEANGSR
jgi:hypothetical protein